MKKLWKFAQSLIGLILRHPITGTNIIPVLPDGRIVLIQRRDNGKWGLPGGMVEWGEDIPTTVRRELFEETGLELVSIGRLVGVYSAPDRDLRFHSICVVMEAQVMGTVEVDDRIEIKSVKAFLPTELPLAQLSNDNSRHLQDYFNGAPIVA
jgi:ADP-ribose pyrophosphatase/8-oxo-dGTP diphosphatase